MCFCFWVLPLCKVCVPRFIPKMKMEFVLKSVSKSSGRLGYLVQTETGQKFSSPLLLQATKAGSIPYLSREVFDYVSKEVHVLQMSLSTMDHMGEALTVYKGGLGAYVGYKGYPTLLTVRDPCEAMPNGFNDKDVVPLFTRRGKETLSSKRFMDLVEAFAPDMYCGLSDADTSWDSAKKRVQKSVDRTEQFMDYCYERHVNSVSVQNSMLFVPIAGGYSSYARSQSIKHAKAKGGSHVGGYIFEGFHNYGVSATEVNVEQLLPIMTHCLGEVEPEKPRMMPGAYTPVAMLELIRLGVDIFDSSYAYCATTNFKALTFHYDVHSIMESRAGTPFIDVTDECFKEDFTPLLSNCLCYACQKHTRAYLHHLYKTSELLGPILLMIHNLHHLMQFFTHIRSSIANDKFANLMELIQFQGTDKPVDYRIHINTKVVTRGGLGKGFANSK